MATMTEKLLGQRRDNNTTTNTIYTVPASTTAIVTSVMITNTTGAAATVDFYWDDAGSTYDQSTAWGFYGTSIPANTSIQVSGHFGMKAGATLGYKQGTANACTVTVHGAEIA